MAMCPICLEECEVNILRNDEEKESVKDLSSTQSKDAPEQGPQGKDAPAKDTPALVLIQLQGCEHSFCKPCLRNWFEACENAVPRHACAPTCPKCRQLIPNEEKVAIMGRPDPDEEIPSAPTAETGTGSSGDSTQQPVEAINGQPADDMANAPAAGGPSTLMDELTRDWMEAHNAKCCFNCGIWIVRTDGCDAMQCLCGHRFCWLCNKSCEDGEYCECGFSEGDFFDNVLDREIYDDEHAVAGDDELSDMRAFLEAHRERLEEV